MTEAAYICQEKEEEEDSPPFKITWMHQKKIKVRLIKVTRNITDNIKMNLTVITWKQKRKKTVWIFQATHRGNLTREDLDMAKKGKLTRETESLLIAIQNNAIRRIMLV